jgi:predicted ester cyclase
VTSSKLDSDLEVEVTNLEIARRWHESYRDGDAVALQATLAPGWVVHEAGGGVSKAEDLAEITRRHRESFPHKDLVYVHEVASGDLVAQFVRYVFVHSGPYLDIQPTGRRVEFEEMVFHRFAAARIAESWRLTHPTSMYDALAAASAPPTP